MKHGFMVRDLELYRGLCRSTRESAREGRRRSHGIDFSAMCISQSCLTSRHQIKLTVDGNGNTLGLSDDDHGLEMKGGQKQVNATFRAR